MVVEKKCFKQKHYLSQNDFMIISNHINLNKIYHFAILSWQRVVNTRKKQKKWTIDGDDSVLQLNNKYPSPAF